MSNTDYFCQGKELSIDVGIIADDFSILNPCTQYNRELPLDLIFEENFNGNTLNTQNWMGDIGHSKYFNGLDENGNTVGEPSTLDYRWSY